VQTCSFHKGRCKFDIFGLGLHEEDKLSIQAATYDSSSCTGSSVAAGITAAFVISQGEAMAFEFPKLEAPVETNMQVGLRFWVCWQAHYTESDALVLIPHEVNLGELNIYGPYVQSQATCALGSTCTLPITGQGFRKNDLVVLKNGASCASSVPAAEDMNILARPPSGEGPLSSPGFTDEDPLGSAETITTREYYLGYLQGGAPGAYAICVSMQSTGNSWVRVGELQVQGPEEEDTHRCSLGEQCSVNIVGKGLSSKDQLAFRLTGAQEGSCADAGSALPYLLLGALSGTFEVSEIVDDGVVFDLGVVLSGNLGRDLQICWRRDASTTYVNAGTLRLYAGDDYLASATGRGDTLMHFASGNIYMQSFFDISDAEHRTALQQALVDFLRVSKADLAMITPPRGYSINTFPIGVRANSSVEATALVKRMDDFTLEQQEAVLETIQQGAPGVWTVSFSEHNVEFALYNQSEYQQWEELWQELSGVGAVPDLHEDSTFGETWIVWAVTGGVAFIVLLCCIAACLLLRLRRLRKAKAAGGVPPPAPGVVPAQLVGRGDRYHAGEGSGKGEGKGESKGRGKAGKGEAKGKGKTGKGEAKGKGGGRSLPSEEEQNMAVMQMLDMGYKYEDALAALRKAGFNVTRAVEQLNVAGHAD